MTFFSRSARICFFKSVNRRLICFDAGMSHRAAATHPLRAVPSRAVPCTGLGAAGRGGDWRGGPRHGRRRRPLRPAAPELPSAFDPTRGLCLGQAAPPRPEATCAKAEATRLSSRGGRAERSPAPPAPLRRPQRRQRPRRGSPPEGGRGPGTAAPSSSRPQGNTWISVTSLRRCRYVTALYPSPFC